MDGTILAFLLAIVGLAALATVPLAMIVRSRFLLTWIRHRNLVFLVTQTNDVIVKPFKVTSAGIAFKIGRSTVVKPVRPQEKLNMYGKSVYVFGMPSSLPLNVQLAMGAHPAALEKAVEETAKERLLSKKKDFRLEDLEKEKENVLNEMLEAVEKAEALKLIEWWQYLDRYHNMASDDNYFIAKVETYLKFIQEGQMRRLVWYAIIIVILIVGLVFFGKALKIF